jgi:hypothetical protein
MVIKSVFEDEKKCRKARNRKYTPIKLFNFYILLTLVISIFGPWEYAGYNKSYVFFYMIIFLGFSTMTYVYFVNKSKGITFVISKNNKSKKKLKGLWVAKKSILMALILFSVMLLIKVLTIGLPEFSNIFRLMAQAYTNKSITASTFNLSAWLFNYFSIFYVGAIVLGSYYFRYLNKRYKIMLILVVVISMAYHLIFVGNQKAIGDLLIFISSALFVKYAQSGKRIRFKVILFVLFGVLCSFLLFSYVIQNRMSLWNVEYYSIGNKAFLDVNHWMLALFSSNIKLGAGTFLYYLSSGYYGLSLTLELPFVWSYGFGSSFELRHLFNRLLPLTDEFIGSYPVRMEAQTGWGAYSNWHTIFPWLASDFTFWGAIIVVCIFIAIYAVSWNRILRNGHWINLLMFANLNIMLLYVPANNQLFQTRASLLVTLIITLLWIFNYNYVGDEI